jgi:hypothetical protein
MDPSSIALQGLQHAGVQLNTAAAKIASAGTASATRQIWMSSTFALQ